jgi:putative restriction endonuclease
VQRIVRSTEVAQFVKAIHAHGCQICGTLLLTAAGPYAEAAHIRPLGRPHDGADLAENVLCLCPNCHVRYDSGAMCVMADWTVWDTVAERRVGILRRDPEHPISPTHLAYHRERIAAITASPSSPP